MQTREFHAWRNEMPPGPKSFHIQGEVYASSPGVRAVLAPREPQEGGPGVAQFDLHLIPPPGIDIQVMTWIQARYDKTLAPDGPLYDTVELFQDGEKFATLEVRIIV